MDLVTWIDNIPVSILSSVPHITSTEKGVVRRNIKDYENWWYAKEVNQPAIFKLYSAFMGGIDLLLVSINNAAPF